MSLLELFVDVDDFCQIFLPIWKSVCWEMEVKSAFAMVN
jgi:hypothetical protein